MMVKDLLYHQYPMKIENLWSSCEASAGLVQDMARTDTKVRQVGSVGSKSHHRKLVGGDWNMKIIGKPTGKW